MDTTGVKERNNRRTFLMGTTLVIVLIGAAGLSWTFLSAEKTSSPTAHDPAFHPPAQLKELHHSEGSSKKTVESRNTNSKRKHGAQSTVQRAPADSVAESESTSTPIDWTIKQGDPLLAEDATPADIAWLNENGFPSTAVMQAVSPWPGNLSDLDISNGVDAFEIQSAELLALTTPSARQQALDFLHNAAMNGSIAALYALAEYHGHPFIDQPILQYAYYTTAYLRGDWGARIQSRAVISKLSNEQKLRAELLALQLIVSLNQRRADFGLAPLTIDTRPTANSSANVTYINFGR